MGFEEEKTKGYSPRQEDEDQDQAIPGVPVFFEQAGMSGARSAHSAAQGLSSNAFGAGSGTPGFQPVNSAAQGLSSNAAGLGSGVPEFRPMNSAARGLSSNAAGFNSGAPEFRPVQSARRTPASSGRAAGKAVRSTAKTAQKAGKASKTAAKAARTTGKSVRSAGNAVRATGQTVRAAMPVAGRFTSIATKIRTVWLTVMATTLATAGVVSVAVNPKTYTEPLGTKSRIEERVEYSQTAVGEGTETTAAPAVMTTEELPTGIPVTDQEPVINGATDGIMFAAEGQYAWYGIPVEIYCDQEVITAGEPITFKADILGGIPPFDVEWYMLVSEDLDHPVKKEITTSDRHLEYTYTPSENDESVKMILDFKDARAHRSYSWSPQDSWEVVSALRAEKWKEEHPNAGEPLNEHFPFIAKTNQADVNMRYDVGTDSGIAAAIPDAGTQLYAVGKAYDETGRKWYKVRMNLDQQGWIRSDLLRIDRQDSVLADLQLLAENGHYSHKSLPVDVYSDHEVYQANEPVNFTAEILGGTPPFDVSWWIEGSADGTNPIDEFLERHQDYPRSVKYVTNERLVKFAFTPPVEGEAFGVHLLVKDAQGIDTYGENWEGGNWPADLWIHTASEWSRNYSNGGTPQEESFPFAAVTNTENVGVRYPYLYRGWTTAAEVPEKGTEVKVTGRTFDETGTKWYQVRLGLDMKNYYIRSDLLDVLQGNNIQEENKNEEEPSVPDAAIGEVMFAKDGYYYEGSDYFPIDVYTNTPKIYERQPLTFNVDILGGIPPFEVKFWITDDPVTYTTEQRHVEYVYTPPADEDSITYFVSVTDAKGKEGLSDETYGFDIDKNQSLFPCSEPGVEYFPFVAETREDNVDVSWYTDPNSIITTIPQKGTKVRVIGRLNTTDYGIRYRVRAATDKQIGYINASQLRKDPEATALMPGSTIQQVTTDSVLYATDGLYYRMNWDYNDKTRYIPIELWCSRQVYHAGEPVTVKTEIMGGVPPFDITLSFRESSEEGAPRPMQEYIESHPECKNSVTIHTDGRRAEFTFTPPFEGVMLYANVTVFDSLGRSNYSDGDNCIVYTPAEWKKYYSDKKIPEEEFFPIMARTAEDNVPVTFAYGDNLYKDIPDAGTLVEVIGRSENGSNLLIRQGIGCGGYVDADRLRLAK